MDRTSRLGSIAEKIIAKLPLIAQAMFLLPLAYAQCETTEMAGVKALTTAMWSLLAAIQGIIWVVIFIAWMTGNLMWAAPSRSMIIKKAGSQQMELSGIAMFLTLMGPGIFALIVFLAQIFGVGSYCSVWQNATTAT